MTAPNVRLKNVAAVRVSNVDKKSVEGEQPVRLCNYTDVYYSDRITEMQVFMTATAAADQISTFRLRRGQTLITKDSELADDIGVPAFVDVEAPDLVCGYHLAQITPDPARVDPRYLFWVIASDRSREQFSIGASGVTRFGLRTDTITGLDIPLPGLVRQMEIASFLDAETARIDALIAAKRQTMVVTDERIAALIGAHIARSELTGAADVPSAPLRRMLQKLSRPADAAAGTITAYRDGQVTLRSDRRAEGYTDAWTEGASRQGVLQGDVVIHGLDGFAGAIGTAERDGACSPVYHVCQPIGGDADYWGRLLRLLSVTGYLGLFASSTRERAVDFRNWQRFGDIPVPVVDRVEQARIGALIRRSRPLHATVSKGIALLKERRQALITAAVTGEIEV